MARLLESFVALLRSWLTIDRVRAGHSLQRITSLQPGETVLIDGELAVVVRREVKQEATGSVLILDCTTERGWASLYVKCLPEKRMPELTWRQEGGSIQVPLEDIAVPMRDPDMASGATSVRRWRTS